MAETMTTSAGTMEQFKAAILELIKENNPQLTQWFKSALLDSMPQPIKNRPSDKKSSKKELPFWKAHPNWQPLDPTPYAISEESLKQVQLAWSDAPNAEGIIAFLTK